MSRLIMTFSFMLTGAAAVLTSGAATQAPDSQSDTGGGNQHNALPAAEQPLQTHTIFLKHAECSAVAKAIQNLFAGTQEFTKAWAFSPVNAVLLRNTPEELEQMIATIKGIDIPPVPVKEADAQEITTAVVHVQHAQAGELAEILWQCIQRPRRRGGHVALKVVPEARLNVLILRGPAEHVADAEALIAQLDRPLATTTD